MDIEERLEEWKEIINKTDVIDDLEGSLSGIETCYAERHEEIKSLQEAEKLDAEIIKVTKERIKELKWKISEKI